MARTLKCHMCGEQFPKEEVVNYASTRAKTGYNYCPHCLPKAQERSHFIDIIYKVFGQGPNSYTWKQRNQLEEKYGYGDKLIADCLEYLYEYENYKPTKLTLAYVTPTAMDRLRRHNYNKMIQGTTIAQAIEQKTEVKRIYVPVREKPKKENKKLNPDDFLE